MKSSITTIEQVSKEVKTKISKLGKGQLLKKYIDGKFKTTEEVVAARFYILKRGTSEFEIAEADELFYRSYLQTSQPKENIETTTTSTTFGKHRSEMTEQEIEQAEKRQEAIRQDVIVRKQFPANVEGSDEFFKANETVEQPIETNDEQSTQKPEKKSSAKKKTSTTQEAQPKAKKEKQPEAPVVKLTEQEFALFEKINEKKNQDLAKLQKSYESLREFKGVLGSLAKKNIIEYSENTLTVLDLGQQMIDGTMPYKQKAKHEQNFFKKERLTIEIDGKLREKSAYVRLLLQKNNNISCAEINEKLATVGFPKLYHSELQRCKEQLNVKTVKKVD